jgi:hypothetical protein
MAPKTKNTKQTKVENSTPVVEQTTTPIPAPVAVVQEAGAKKAPVKKAPVAKKAPAVVQEAGAKKAPVKKAPVAKKAPAVVQEAGAKKAPVKKAPVAKKEKVVAPENEEDEETDEDPKTRSFKVKLPGDEGFTGRFTGLTPYQAANKALSKYFRGLETEDNSQVNFSIRESTRGSKRHEYVYKGSRLKLEKPITYTIKSVTGDERVITKQYKNQLIKVKKGIVKQESVTV